MNKEGNVIRTILPKEERVKTKKKERKIEKN